MLSAMLFIGVAVSQAAPVQLLTAKQAAQPDLPRGKLPPVAQNAPVPDAPNIVFDNPRSGSSTAAPFAVKVRFVAAKDAKVVPNTLKIHVLKVAPISISKHVKPYLSDSGINIPEATIPAGKYTIRVLITDDKGREGVAEGTWVVK